MKSAIAILTYNRSHALSTMLDGIDLHCSNYEVAIFDDLSLKDNTEAMLRTGEKVGYDHELLAVHYKSGFNRHSFIGTRNLGVAKNSNRAIRWFLERTDADHLLLCNDDLHVLGDFPSVYAKAHSDLGVGMFGFNDFSESPSHRWIDIRKRGYVVKICPRMTGIMTSITRSCLNRIGYYDAGFGKFGNEHCDHNNRARMAGFINLDGVPQPQLDITTATLKHQNVETSVTGNDRAMADAASITDIESVAKTYKNKDIYRPFLLHKPEFVQCTNVNGIPFDAISEYMPIVIDQYSEYCS